MDKDKLKFRIALTAGDKVQLRYVTLASISPYLLNNGHNISQFSGKKCFNGHELYDGDIVFYEEETDEGDRRFYLVITWVEEWCMFASLFHSEYKKYLENGVEELDEVLFWTYNLQDSERYHYAGNIFENPDFLTNLNAHDE